MLLAARFVLRHIIDAVVEGVAVLEEKAEKD